MGFISKAYEWKLKNAIKKQDVPKHIVLALSENDLLTDDNYSKLNSFVTWCKETGIGTVDRKSTRLNSSHIQKSRMPSSA